MDGPTQEISSSLHTAGRVWGALPECFCYGNGERRPRGRPVASSRQLRLHLLGQRARRELIDPRGRMTATRCANVLAGDAPRSILGFGVLGEEAHSAGVFFMNLMVCRKHSLVCYQDA